MDITSFLLGKPIEAVITYFTDRQKFAAQAKAQKIEIDAALHTKRIENIAADRAAEVEWNKHSAANSGWKDEYLTIVLSLPMIGAFFPFLVEHIRTGFAVLETLPSWYQGGVMLMISSAFAYQKYMAYSMNKAYTLPTLSPVKVEPIKERSKA